MHLLAPFNSDGYKLGHPPMYTDGTNLVYANSTPRSDRIHRIKATRYYDGKLLWVGGQGALMEIVESWDKFFSTPKHSAIARFKNLCDNYLGPNVVNTERLEKLHDLGYLPLEIKTLDEGTKVPMGIPVLTIKNTVDHAFWLVNFLETVISDLTWKTATNATIAAEYKAMLTDFAKKTGSPLEGVLFQAHDFSARGMSGPEDAARSGFGHIVNFLGTDTLGSVIYAQEYYGAGDFVAASVPATEHAVATSNILNIEQELLEKEIGFPKGVRLEAEKLFMKDLITRKFPNGIVSYVADSFDFWAVLTEILPSLKDTILSREGNGITPGKLVIRPDSGDPVKVVCGYGKVVEIENDDFSTVDCAVAYEKANIVKYDGKFYIPNSVEEYSYERYELTEISEVEVKGAIEVLWEIFGGTVTEQGYKLLDEHIGLIYGDSITPQRALAILERLEEKGFASGNVVFGVGSYTYQCNTRDTFGFAVKATYTEVNGKGIEIFKDPKTDSKKKSAKGLLHVYEGMDGLILKDQVDEWTETQGLLKTRFKDGASFNQTTLDEIRKRL